MNELQAIELIKKVIDESVKGGLIQNIETAANVHNAWFLITQKLEYTAVSVELQNETIIK